MLDQFVNYCQLKKEGVSRHLTHVSSGDFQNALLRLTEKSNGTIGEGEGALVEIGALHIIVDELLLIGSPDITHGLNHCNGRTLVKAKHLESLCCTGWFFGFNKLLSCLGTEAHILIGQSIARYSLLCGMCLEILLNEWDCIG